MNGADELGLPRGWRDGDLLVVPALARIDDRCFACGEPAATSHRQEIYWHRPAWYLLLLLSPIVYLFVALAVRRRAELIVGLCRAHATARRKQHVIGWGLVALAVALVAVAIALGAAILGLLVPIALVIGVVMIGLAGHIVRVRSIDHNTARISNGSPRLREGLPDLPGRLW